MPTIDILDGGTATALEARGLSLDTSLWSAAAVLDAPDAIRHVHTSFLNANSLIIESCTYQITPHSFGSTENAADAMHAAIDIARKAIAAAAAGSASHAQLALSLGPYAVAQADGSEYTGVYHSLPSDTTLINNLKHFHLTRLRMVRDTVDILLFETIPLLSEVRAIRQAVHEWRQERENEHTTYTRSTPPLYISLVFPDGTLPGSKLATEKTDTMDDVVDAVFGIGGAQVTAIGINCTKPKYLEGLVRELVESMHRAHITHGPKLMLYPDGGRNFNTESRTWEDSEADATESTWAKMVVDAAALVMEDTASRFSGVIVGGCCMTSAEHIKCLHEACKLRGWLDV